MITYGFILVTFILYRLSVNDSRVFASAILLALLCFKMSFLLVAMSKYLITLPLLFLIYAIIQSLTIYIAKKSINKLDKSQFAILALFFISIGYNMLTVSQYVAVKYGFYSSYDFYSFYQVFIGSVIILELLLLSWNVKYVADYRESHRDNYINFVNRLFFFRGWIPNRGLF